MEKSVSEKTWEVEGSLDARTVDAMRAAFVEREAGYLWKSMLEPPFSTQGGGSWNSLDLATIIEEEDIDTH